MNTNTRIVFFGTPDFAVASLKSLVDNQYNVVGVVTSPDKPAGRGRKLRSSAVKKYALEAGLPILQPQKLKDPSFLEELHTLQPDLQIIVAFRMLPKLVWDLPPLGTFNLHASLLPQYRGAAPINWAIINGDTVTGNTTFLIDDKIDTGATLLHSQVEITAEDTAGSLHDKLMKDGMQLVLKTVDGLVNKKISAQPQCTTIPLKSAPKLYKENTKIDWTSNGDHIYNFIRGLSPYPLAWCFFEQLNEAPVRIKVGESRYERTHIAPDSSQVGHLEVTDQKEFKVTIPDGYIYLCQVQFPGKKMMSTKALLNGLVVDLSAKIS